MRILRLSFFAGNTVDVAKDLLGKILVKRGDGGFISGKIVEDEAYRGSDDPASHAYRGLTQRNRLMFGRAGYSYVYLIHGNHNCFNVTTEREGVPGAVLIRAIEPLAGIDVMRQKRRLKHSDITQLTNGPGKLCKAMGITSVHNGIDLTLGGEIFFCHTSYQQSFNIVSSCRIGIKKGVDKLWRFYIEGNRFVSNSSL